MFLKGSCREAAEGIKTHVDHRNCGNNPSVTAAPCHLPLHKGGFDAADRTRAHRIIYRRSRHGIL